MSKNCQFYRHFRAAGPSGRIATKSCPTLNAAKLPFYKPPPSLAALTAPSGPATVNASPGPPFDPEAPGHIPGRPPLPAGAAARRGIAHRGAVGRALQDRDFPVLNDYRAVLGGLFRTLWGLSAVQCDAVFPSVRPLDLKLV